MSYVNNLRTFIRIYELGNMSAAGRDLRVSAAVASSRILELERQLGVRLFNRTTRSLKPTTQGDVFYKGAVKILDAIHQVEGDIAEITSNPKGTLFVAAPLGIGKRLIAPLVPDFKREYPDIMVRLRLSDRSIDVVNEGLDAAFVVGAQVDSELRIKTICEFERVLCASPGYVSEHGTPETGDDILADNHNCLLLRFPGAREFFWVLRVKGKKKRFNVSGTIESDDGDVLTAWALCDCGIINKPLYEVSSYLKDGDLVRVATETPPTPQPFSCVYSHKRLQDPKARLFIDYMVDKCRYQLN